MPPTVKVLWDAMPDLDEDSSTSNQVLQPNKWKKKSKFGWRMDIDVEMFENYHDTVDNNNDAEDNMNVNVNDDDDKDDEDVRLAQTGQCTQYILGKCTCTIIRENVHVQLSGKMYMYNYPC